MAKKTTTTKTAPPMQTVHVRLPTEIVSKSRVVASQRGLRSLNALMLELLYVATKGTKLTKRSAA